MATVEQCETQSSGLPSMSNTLNLYDDTFKPSQEEEKDSDEESFHLPMLDCDDDIDSNTKETLINDMGKDLHNGETEDEILNKFETNGTPDIDPKMEDSILDEIDNLFEKKIDEQPVAKNVDCDNELQDVSVVTEKEVNTDEKNCTSVDPVLEEHESKNNETVTDDKENEENVGNITKVEDVILEDEKIANKDQDITLDITDEKVVEDKHIEDKAIGDDVNKMESDPQLADEKISDDNIITDVTTKDSNETEFSELNITVQKTDNLDATIQCEDEQSELKKSIESTAKINNSEDNNDQNDVESKTSTENTDMKTHNCGEAMEIDTKEKEQTDDNFEEVGTIKNEVPAKVNNVCEDSNEDRISTADNSISEDQKSSTKDTENQFQQTTMQSEDHEDIATVDNAKPQSSSLEPEKCENSNDSSKSQNLECDDLLDISIIRDADEDNASAIEENANDRHTSEKSDNDNDDQDEGSDKAENELDESEMDQDDTLLANDKEDHMDFEDGSSNLCDQDNVINGSISDSENKNIAEARDSETESRDSSSSSVLKQKSDSGGIERSDERNGTEDEISSNIEPEVNEGKQYSSSVNNNQLLDSVRDNSTKCNGKRSLSEADITESPIKKIKLTDRSKTEGTILTHKNKKIKTLLSFEKYMQNKKLENKLTRSDLEQFCLQKICEAIMHKTDVGELHQTIKKQEQIIENLRKDLQQLTKQTRDLDIVNKKLMNELRTQNGTKKPLVPLKITRSVGLQVKLNASTETNNRRKGPAPTTPRTPTLTNNNTATPRVRTITPANSAVVRQVAASPRKPPTPVQTPAPAPAPLLSQALQTRTVTPANNVPKRPPIRAKPAEPQKPANSSVIDLTDEDDRSSKAVVGNSVNILNKIPLPQGKTINIIPAKTVANKIVNSNQKKTVTVNQVKASMGTKVGTPTRTVAALPQGVRLTSTQVKNGSIAIPASVVTSNSGTTQFMYVVQPGSVVTSTAGGTQKAVLLNFQPTNGVLSKSASTINGSAVSVLPSKASNTVQLKTVAPRKHPAPLPSPPPMSVNSSLKPLLPKPHLSIRKTDTGIILQWRMPYNLDIYEAIASYQLFAYQETNAPPSTEMWRKVGDVKALALPMACTLTQFADKNKYYFAVRSIDVHKRIGAFSEPEEISL